MERFLDDLNKNAFSNLDITGYSPDLYGWKFNQFDSTFKEFIKNKSNKNEPLIIIEVGTWKGLSASTMANISKSENFNSIKIITIDTWLGAPEFWTSYYQINDATRRLDFKDGYPSVFYTFTKNMKYLKHDDCIYPFPISSIQGGDVLTYYNIKADVIYIDAAHEYDQVLADIKKYWPLLKCGGMIFGDDYTIHWPGVIKAVDEFVKENNLTLTNNNGLWSIIKSF